MRLSLQTVICCCVFTTVLPPVQGETEEPKNFQNKSLSDWLQDFLRSRQNISLEMATANKSDILVELLKNEDGESPTLPSSCEENMRSKRSSSKQSGCRLSTCAMSQIVDKLDKIDRMPKRPCVSQKRLEKLGRRRRSPADISLLALLTGSIEAAQQL